MGKRRPCVARTNLTEQEKSILKNLPTDLLEKVVQSVSNTFSERYKQEFISLNQESLENCIRKYKDVAAQITWRNAQQCCKWTENGPVLTPDKSRIYYRRGDREIVLQEHAPQLRNLRFEREGDKKVISHTLALPYINFLFVFNKGMLEKTLVTFCDQPLKNLKEPIYKPYFSNISDTMNLCYGHSFNTKDLKKGELTQQIVYTLDLFWQTIFKMEWTTNFLAYKNHFSVTDERLATLEKWEENSIEDFLFVLDVKWLKWNSYEDYGSLITSMFNSTDSMDAKFQNNLYSELVEQLSSDISSEFVFDLKPDTIKNISEKVSNSLVQSIKG